MENKYNTLSIVGSQWGDEGKGKITDLLGKNQDYVVRYQGGNNAGHTIKFNDKKFSLHILPSGVFNEKSCVVIASGVVVNPTILMNEVKMIEAAGYKVNLKISNRANVIMPYHIDLDEYLENIKGPFKVGTTKKGIGPCYSDKINRLGIRMAEFFDDEIFLEKLKLNLMIKEPELQKCGSTIKNADEIFKSFSEERKFLVNYCTDTSLLLDKEIKNGKKVLFEGAQGVMLDLEHGTFPYVTSSSPSTSSIPINTGISASYINNVLGIVKAYTSRVGEGSFPTEVFGEIAETIREEGHEYGTTTKRPRRVGWLDLIQLKYSLRISGINQIALMLVDVLQVVDEIKVGYQYQINDEVLETLPALEKDFHKIKVSYKTFKSWKISNPDTINKYNDLPKELQEYIEYIESFLQVPVKVVSYGAKREETLVR